MIIKKIILYVAVFILTTAFFKSALEKCADENIKSWKEFNKFAEYREEKKTDKEIEERNKKRSELKKKCNLAKEIKENSTKMSYECLKYRKFILYESSDYNSIKVRDISPEENLRNYKNYIRKSLKVKIKDQFYEKSYASCIKEEKSNPKLFDAKY